MSEQEETNQTTSNSESPEQSITWHVSCPPDTTVSIPYPNQYYSNAIAYTVASTSTAYAPISTPVSISDTYTTTDLDVRIEEAVRRILAEEIAKLEQRIHQNLLDDLARQMRLKGGRRSQ